VLKVEAALMQLMRIEPEDQAITAVHLLTDLYRIFHQPMLEDKARSFIVWMVSRFRALPALVASTFSDQGKDSADDTTADESKMETSSSSSSKSFLPGAQSFRVMTECIGLLHVLMQIPKLVVQILPELIGALISALTIIPDSQQQQSSSGLTRSSSTGGSSSASSSSNKRADLCALQAKALAVVWQFARETARDPNSSPAAVLNPHGDALINSVLKLLMSCPQDAVTSRKSFLERYKRYCGVKVIVSFAHF
jgi:hypothetical protein